MAIVDSLTPKDTEEVKPGLFIQKTKNGYRHINPMAWNNEIRWKEQLSTVFSFRTVFFILIVSFIWFGYLHDFREYKNFYDNITDDPREYCIDVITHYMNANDITIYTEIDGQDYYPSPLQNNS